MTVDLLRRAATEMDAEADRLDAMDRDAVRGNWVADPSSDAPGQADMIVHRRNTLARDAATLRAQAALLRDESRFTNTDDLVVAIARAFLDEPAPQPPTSGGHVHRMSS